MMVNLVDKIGDWNPQLLREIKGRLKFVNVAIALAISLLSQTVLFLYQLADYPGEEYSLIGKYCGLRQIYQDKQNLLNDEYSFASKLVDKAKLVKPLNKENIFNLQNQLKESNSKISDFNEFLTKNYCPDKNINMEWWWRDHYEYIFLTLSAVFIFTLLIAGTYLLINDLAKEEHRGTLNFIRLTPQSEASILTGKMLGVPILIYILSAAAIPLHLWAGRGAKIALSYTLSFYAVLVASCIFFFSAALLFALVSRWFSAFQPWLGTGIVLGFLWMTMMWASHYSSANLNNPITALRLLSPWDMTDYLFPNLFNGERKSPLTNLQIFYLPIGQNLFSLVGFVVLYYGVATYGIWQALQRCFRNPNATVINKIQSYLFMTFCQVMIWGFTLQYNPKNYCVYSSTSKNSDCSYNLTYDINQSFVLFAICNLVLLFGLIAILSPHRQTIQDWARYRHQNVSQKPHFWRNSWLEDLISGDKSPALVAIGINLAIATIPFIIWAVFGSVVKDNNYINGLGDNIDRIKIILAVALFITLMMIYATITQMMLLMKNRKRSIWAVGTVGTAIFLPPMILGMLRINPEEIPMLWLFSTFPWASIQYSQITTIFMALLSEFAVLALLNFQFTRQVKIAGESASKALLATGVRN